LRTSDPSGQLGLIRWKAMRSLSLAASGALLALTACHSAYIAVSIQNRTTQPVALLEVDYPSASFGTQNLAPGAEFHYRFKVLGSGATSLTWTDAAHHDHKSAGPSLKEGDEGRITIQLTENEANWSESLTSH
jgi:hypothetical protein